MKLISHRGNIIGPVPNRENSPSYIDAAISAGYEVEIDVSFIDDKLYLGHDSPDYEVTLTWLNMRKEKLWIHCKNLESAIKLSKLENIKLFCHTSDPYIFTSNNYLWVHDLNLKLNNRCIIPLLSEIDIISYNKQIVYGVCTDYITFAEFNLKQKGLYK